MNSAVIRAVFRLFDALLVPISIIYWPLAKLLRKYGIENFPLHNKLFAKLGVYPLIDHYYDPRFVYDKNFDATVERNLHINFRVEEQLAFLHNLQFSEELNQLKVSGNLSVKQFYYDNPAFSYGDADLYYLMIRNAKPSQIIEIGSGFSTLVAVEAIQKNKADGITTKLTCIEPYEFAWLETLPDVNILRKKVEEVSIDFFATLNEGDILFIDSSHIIRPGNDVLFEYLNILPSLKKGVLIHIHDIFSPHHYPLDWLKNKKFFWNEQYLLEAFLCYNESFKVKLALNMLKHQHFNALQSVCNRILPTTEPGSFWMEKTA